MNYSRILAQQLPAMVSSSARSTANFVRLVYSTSPLHDIGKVGIRTACCSSPAALDDRSSRS